MPISYITLDEFSRISGVKEETVKRKYKEIPGITKSGNTYLVLEGTRYPVDRRTIRPKTREEKVYYLLKAISEERFISSDNLGLYDEQFSELITALLRANLIKNNCLCNDYGANQYDITPDGSDLLRNKKVEATRLICSTLADLAGTFVGSAYAAAST